MIFYIFHGIVSLPERSPRNPKSGLELPSASVELSEMPMERQRMVK